MSETSSRDRTYEVRDVTGRGMIVFVVVFVLVTVLLIAALTLFARAIWLLPQEPFREAETLHVAPRSGPALQADPPADLRRLMMEHEKRLTSFGWVDRKNGIAHVPIEEAMRLAVERARKERQ